MHYAAGNITADNRAGSTCNYTISAAGRISQVKLGTQIRVDYLYDGKSRLAQSIRQNVTNAGTTRYIHDANDRIIAEVSSTGAAIREYVWLDDLPIAVLDGSVNQANPSLFWVHADHLNRPVMMTDATRAVVWRAFYEPFGAVHSITGPAANDNRFPGQLFQLETGLAYNWHRHYDATIGRYVSADPLGLTTLLSDGPSAYGYATQKPVERTDPTGLDVDVCYYGDAAMGFGHVGFGMPGENSTKGFYPTGNPVSSPGIVKPDTQNDKQCKRIEASSDQD